MKSKLILKNKSKFTNITLKELLLVKPRNGLYKLNDDPDIGNRWIKMKTIFENGIISNQKMERIKVTPEEEEKFSCKNNDLVFSRTSILFEGVGKCCIINNVLDKPIFESNTFMIRLDLSKSVPKFYFYYFNSLQGRNNIYGIIRQTAASQITSKDLIELSVPYPPLTVQQNISNFLFSIDQMILNLKDRNKILEKIIQLIFKSWFVDFDGQTEFIDSELGQIPKGWRVEELKNLLTENGYIRGPFGSSLLRKELKTQGIPVYEQQQVLDNHRDFRFFIDEEKFRVMNRFSVKENDILITCSGTVGKISLISKNDPIGIISQALLILRPNKEKIPPKFLEYFLRSKEGQNNLASVSIGTVQINLAKRETIQKIKIIIPTFELMSKFEKLITIITEQVTSTEKQIEQLLKIRDSLLPKLMSGEIRV